MTLRGLNALSLSLLIWERGRGRTHHPRGERLCELAVAPGPARGWRVACAGRGAVAEPAVEKHGGRGGGSHGWFFELPLPDRCTRACPRHTPAPVCLALRAAGRQRAGQTVSSDPRASVAGAGEPGTLRECPPSPEGVLAVCLQCRATDSIQTLKAHGRAGETSSPSRVSRSARVFTERLLCAPFPLPRPPALTSAPWRPVEVARHRGHSLAGRGPLTTPAARA